jgi:5-methylcytosine-specific restriction protein B
MASEVNEDGESMFRRSLLLETLFEVLRKAEGPLAASEALRRVREAVDLTPREDSYGPGGKHRTDTFVSFGSAWATAVGWMTKKGGWALTEAGTAALDELADKDTLYPRLYKLYRQTIKRRETVTAPKDPRWATVIHAMSLIPAGWWTAYKDLGELVGLPGLNVGQFIAKNDVPNAQRVLQVGGTVAPEFSWDDPERTDDPKQMLIDEGVEFDSSGRANQAQRLTAEELRELIGEEDDTAPSSRAWLVRGASVNGLNLVPTWLAKGSCSLAASRLRAIEPPVSRKEIATIVEDDYSHVSYNARNEKTSEFDAFLNRMQLDDIVVTTSGGAFYVGRVAGDALYLKSPDDRSNLRRAVVWANADSPIDFTELPDALTVKLSSQHAVVDLTNEIGSLKDLLEQPRRHGDVKLVVRLVEATLPDATDELAKQLLVDREWLQEQIELLRDRRQLIFYGPPGTGKTYLAQAIAEHLTDREAIKLVQFHPAYSYEDFFEGFRPVSSADGSGVAFKLSPGPFRRLVDAARENPGTAYVLIIDEINRANLAKVFGELYFLLEYRGHAIDLLYSAGDEAAFTLPKNVYLIGTMNTADRSIALVDTAMRRRFAFTALHPSEEPTSGVLGKWLAAEGHSQVCAQVLGALNGLIEDDDFKIGPSYFMRSSAQTDTGLQRVWKSSILPLLEEHHYGESLDVGRRYDLARILRSIASADTASSEVGNDGDLSSDPEQEPDEVL